MTGSEDLQRAVVAIGGNSLIRDPADVSVAAQYETVRATCRELAAMIEAGWQLAITHGNGPQVGFVMRRAERAREELPLVPLDAAVADTQGGIGYLLQRGLREALTARGLEASAVTVVTQVVVGRDDPAFQNATKPIGAFLGEAEARARSEAEGWTVVEDAGRGWRRVVPSPLPRRIVELDAIETLLRRGFAVICVGGGGIPVVEEDGSLTGVEAVIDKDHASSLLATGIAAQLFLISTAVETVALNFGTAEERPLDRITVSDAKRYLSEGHFLEGSMRPKVESVVRYLENGGQQAIITDPEHIEAALAGDAGTRILRA